MVFVWPVLINTILNRFCVNTSYLPYAQKTVKKLKDLKNINSLITLTWKHTPLWYTPSLLQPLFQISIHHHFIYKNQIMTVAFSEMYIGHRK